jgi:hypothetical protein
MNKNENIVNELKELNSRLTMVSNENCYQVPVGYFESIAAQVLSRIRALESTDVSEELSHLSPFVSSLSKQVPYSIPAGYFESISESIQHAIKDGDEPSAVETEHISPLLAGLKKNNPYSAPPGYFETLADNVAAKESRTEAKVIAITRNGWLRYAAAAVVAGFIIMAGLFIIDTGNKKESGETALARVTKDVKKLSEVQKDELIDFLDAGLDGNETARLDNDNKNKLKEIQQLLQDVPEEELKNFSEQTEDIEEVLMTN